MAHHGEGPGPFADEFSSRAQARAEIERIFGKLGATGKHPLGKLTKDDEGEIGIAIGEKAGKVVIDFGKLVTWIGFTAEQAEQIADSLRNHAREIRLRGAAPQRTDE